MKDSRGFLRLRPWAHPDNGRRGGVIFLLAGAIILLLPGSYGMTGHVLDFGAAWLAAWWFWAGLALGAQGTLWMQRLTGGGWIDPIAQPLNHLRAGTPAVGLLVLPLLVCLPELYPWARLDWVDPAKDTSFRELWFQPLGFALRTMIYVLLWTLLARLDGAGGRAARRQGYAAVGLTLYAVTISLAAVDLLMSLTPVWYSTAFGLVVLVAQLKQALAAATYAAARRASADTRGDLGNLLLMYALTWAYIAFTQFQIIWAENLPAEISWYLPRLSGPWAYIGLALVVSGLALPLLVLLSRGFKRNARCLRGLAMLLLVVATTEVIWWVFPSVPGVDWQAAWMTVLAWSGMGLVLHGTARCFPTRLPPLPDARKQEKEPRHA